MNEGDKARVQLHVWTIASQLHNKQLSLREKQLLAMLDQTVEALEQLDILLTIVPPDLFIYPVEQFKQWQRARVVAEAARDLQVSVLGTCAPREKHND